MEEEYLKLIEESGTEVIYLDEAERDRFREACSGVYEEMRSYVNNPEVIDMALWRKNMGSNHTEIRKIGPGTQGCPVLRLWGIKKGGSL